MTLGRDNILANVNGWPSNKVILKKIDQLTPYARNARTHSDAQIAQIASSIKEWGWTNPVLIDEGGDILAGHGRLAAARKLGITDIPCMVAEGWSDAQKKAYILADNQLALNAGWDIDMLKVEIGDLNVSGFDLGLIGFDDNMLANLLNDPNTGLTDPDDAPEVPANPVSELGDVWVLGKHRLACGDSTDAGVVAKVLGPVKPHLMVTDPPYGVNHDPSWREKAGVSTYGKQAGGLVRNDDKADWRQTWALFHGDVAYIWQGDKQLTDMAAQLAENGFECRNLIVWAKPQMIFGRGDYHTQHETCWYAVRKGKTGHYGGDRKQTTLWSIGSMHVMGGAGRGGKENPKTGHSTQKPVECMKRPIENNSSPGQAVYEPFSGSGTTIIAGEMTGRHIYAIELSPAYVDVAVTRWQEFTGQTAILESTGKTFEETKQERIHAAR